MDRSGRFDFWGMLLRTRAITPPPAMPRFWLQFAKLPLPGWLVLTVVVAIGIASVLYVRSLPSEVVKQPTMVASPNAERPSAPW
jgi:hypothetical protein